jgi:hypothetical protein
MCPENAVHNLDQASAVRVNYSVRVSARFGPAMGQFVLKKPPKNGDKCLT